MRAILSLTLVLLSLTIGLSQGVTPPLQPSSGPGGSQYLHGDVLKNRYGKGGQEYWIFEPDSPKPRTAPVIVLLHGWGGMNPLYYGAWIDHLVKRGNIVISPGTPDGSLFFEGADRVFPEFLDAILRDYKVRGGKLHVAGHSNGGLSAFHVAAKYPQYFLTVAGYPGLLENQSDPARINVLKPMCLFIHVGDQDPSWASAMQMQYERLQKQGFKIRYAVERNQVHRLKAAEINLSQRLFDQIEGCK